jgi:anaerobic selenocysteine-containing dehydrogenase
MLSLMDESAENPQFSIAAIGPGLKEQLRSLSLTTCARECGIAKEKIRYLARRLMQEGPYAAVIPGPGVFAQPKGLETAILIYWLNRIIGAVPGSKGLIQSSDAIFTEAEKTSGSDSATISRAGPLDQAPGALMIWRADPAYHEPELIRDILLKNTETSLAVTVDQRISETAAISDYILPDTTYLERWDICRLPGFLGKSGFSVRKPAVGSLDPDTRAYYPIIAKAKVMEDIFLDLGNELSLDGFEQPKEKADRINAYKVFERRLDSLIEASENLPHRGGFRINRSMITERGIFLFDPEPVSKPVAGPETLPEIPAILPDKPAKGLILITYTLPFHRSPYSGVNSWLLEIIPSNRAIINTEDAKERGIHQNDQVRIMPVGSEIVIQCKAQVSPGIRPGVIALASGFGYDQYGAKGQTIDNTLIKGNKPRSEGVNPSELVGKAVLVSREIS